MSRSTSRSAAGNETLVRCFLALFFVVIWGFFICFGLIAGAAIFTKLERLPSSSVGLMTLYRYWEVYSGYVNVRKSLTASSFVALVFGLVPVIAVIALALISKFGNRSLFGDARFARPAEIRKSGLVEKYRG